MRLRETSPGAVRLDHDSGEHDDQAVTIGIACAVLQGAQAGGPAVLHRPTGRFDKRAAAGLEPAATTTPKGNVVRQPSPTFPPGTRRGKGGCSVSNSKEAERGDDDEARTGGSNEDAARELIGAVVDRRYPVTAS